MLNINTITNILNNNAPEFIESLAQQSSRLTQQHFGRTIGLYAPLYLSNYCSSYCTYCGFNSHYHITRFKLTDEQIHQEMNHLSHQGIETILLLTGESYKTTPLSYLLNAAKIAKKYFSNISLEVHPMEESDYKKLFQQGVDGITVYQETYDRARYKEVHLSGLKADYDFRLKTAHRAASVGIRQISLGILLGLSDLSTDLLSLYQHLKQLEKDFPGVEYSLSFPRFRSIKGQTFSANPIDDTTFIKIICLTRILFPRVGINLSTRETAQLRDHAVKLGITRISAGSNTSVGGYTLKTVTEQDPQFDIKDTRSVNEVVNFLKQENIDPIFTDWRTIPNEVV